MRGLIVCTAVIGMGLGAGTAAGQEPGHEHPAAATTPAEMESTPLYDNLGSYHLAVTTRSPVAQRYFDQGIRLTYGFNHDEAIKAFSAGAGLDSTCAMCWWGIAYALGPNINLPMDTAAVKPAWEALQQAVRFAPGVSPKEQAFIHALEARYSSTPAADRPSLDSAWARAIGEVAKRYPRDDDAATLYAESLMDLRPWNYWNNAGKPRVPATLETVAVLERVTRRNPNHPGACHFYIHALEASNDAARALPCAERLASLVPGAGHLVHMPTHVYMRLGRWELAAEGNVHATHVDQQYVEERHPTGVYAIGYVPHNFHVMWGALQMLGRSADALQAARDVESRVPVEIMRAVPPLEVYGVPVVWTLARFSRWDEILQMPAPPADLRFTTGMWHWACGLAFAAEGRFDEAAAARDSVAAIRAASPEGSMVNLNQRSALLGVAERHLTGELLASQGRTEEAIGALREGIAIEDELTYAEPADWAMPLRQPLGALLLAAGRPKEAETAFREDLVRYPENGWSLNGLARSLTAQGRAKEAAAAAARFRKVWSRADVQIAATY
jgi:tetratricopeptide (TPR) repeat protein